MAHDSKRGFFSSLFGRKRHTEQEETAELESRYRLEARIQQILAERVEIPKLTFVEEKQVSLMKREEEAEPEVELLPISASVLSRRKAPVPAAFLLSGVEDVRSFAANER
jgi:hypothetical protein